MKNLNKNIGFDILSLKTMVRFNAGGIDNWGLLVGFTLLTEIKDKIESDVKSRCVRPIYNSMMQNFNK